ncbi:MAG: GHKL domain-containing protein, partial [Endomicrobium sp.]|nr:GHKL domain-containing protein [Endomicrobium sp.]
MSTHRLVKWSKESQEFFEKAEDNSLVLDLVISYGCASQTGEGFEELVNSINNESIKRKVKKVVITDTSYLYRHIISQLSGYCDVNIPTEWYLKNKEAIEKLAVDVEIKSWANEINKEEYKEWYRKIKKDFVEDSDFKNSVIDIANAALLESGEDDILDIGRNIDFMLEETTYTCLNFNNVNMVYPMALAEPINIANKKYNINVRHLSYTISWHAQQNRALVLDRNKVNNEILKFITQDATNVNFFVIDRYGKHIYKNNSLSKIVEEVNAKELDLKTWDNSVLVMKEKKQMIFEETDKHKDFLSVKAPLIINGRVEGVIGLGVDITLRKRAEELEKQKELHEIAKGVAHDICSPISAFEMIKYMCNDKLDEQEQKMFELAIRSIKSISGRLLSKYRSMQNKEKDEENKKDDQYIAPYSIKDVIDRKRYECSKKPIQIKYNPDEDNKFVFIRGDFSNFSRMMSNLINNAVEAVENIKKQGEGIVEVSYDVKGVEVEVIVKDNGEGMPQHMVEKINKGEAVGTTKEDGNGIGMEQILGTIKELKGELVVKSKQGEGTEFKLRFAKCEKPKWFVDKIEIKKGSKV